MEYIDQHRLNQEYLAQYMTVLYPKVLSPLVDCRRPYAGFLLGPQVDASPLLPHSVPTWNPTRLDLAGSNLQVGPGKGMFMYVSTARPPGRPPTHPPGATLVSPTS